MCNSYTPWILTSQSSEFLHNVSILTNVAPSFHPLDTGNLDFRQFLTPHQKLGPLHPHPMQKQLLQEPLMKLQLFFLFFLKLYSRGVKRPTSTCFLSFRRHCGRHNVSTNVSDILVFVSTVADF